MKQLDAAKIFRRNSSIHVDWHTIVHGLPWFALLLLGLWNLTAPPLWWDEGWTLSVARNWAEHGHYGRLLDGQRAPPGLEAAFTVTAPIALSFKLFGVGIWQGRLFGVICMVVALVLMYYLANRLYNQRIAIGTLVALLLMPMHPQLHPLIMGRQVLGELPMFVYLLAGYTLFIATLTRSLWFLPLAIIFWSIGIIAKIQALPFWSVSLLVLLILTLYRRQWRLSGLLGLSLGGTLILWRLLPMLQHLLLQDATLPVTPISGLYNVMALVLVPFNRLFALQMTLIVGFPTVLGLGYATWKYLRQFLHGQHDTNDDIVRLMLLVLSGSWFAWYLLLSVGVPRYLFPATFFGSMFVAAFLYDLTSGFSLVKTIQQTNDALRRLRFTWQSVGATLSIVFIAATVSLTLLTFQRYYLTYEDRSAQRVAHYFNTQTPQGILIETYESELHFLIDRPYHYPPDQLHVELNRRSLLQEEMQITYDPLVTDPDYLVIGRFSRENDLYQPLLQSNAFRLLFHDGLYEVYERIR